jgi:hypothetical protein
MSDVNETEIAETASIAKREYSEMEIEMFKEARKQRDIISKTLKDGTSCCLPGPNGYADTEPVLNITTGTAYRGANFLYLKEHQRKIAAPAGKYITEGQLEKAKLDIPGLSLKEGSAGVTLYINERHNFENTVKNFKLFNIFQTTEPKKLEKWAEQKSLEKEKEREAFLREKYGDFYEERPKKEAPVPVLDIACSSTKPEEYLAQYFAAVGGKFKASKEQGKEFSEKLLASLYEKMENGYTDTFKLSRITNASSEITAQLRQPHKQEQKQEQELKHEKKHGFKL